MNDTITTHDLYARHADTNGRVRAQCHRVWDAQRFLEARESDAQKLNAEVKGDGTRLAKFEVISAQQYQQERA